MHTEDQKDRRRANDTKLVAEQIQQSNDNWPMMLDIFAFLAKETRAKYLAFVKEGFTEVQAIELCKARV